MGSPVLTLGELAAQVRSKNAGPFWLTLDIFLRNEPDYRYLVDSGVLTPERIGALYKVDPATVQSFELPGILALKLSFPRSVTAGSFADRDLHAGQQYVPLAGVVLPPR
jgi:hypothetical protein